MSIDQTTTPPTTHRTFTDAEVVAALNKAADDILEATDAGDEGLRDAINLMVNAAVSYLRGDAANLTEAVDNNYDEATLADVLNWIARGVR
jgi:hypothetical protein